MEWDPAARSAKENYFFMTSAVAPRPIAWVTTVDQGSGLVNVAPFSWFQAVCADPPMVMLAISDRRPGEPKDTLRNIEATGEFVVNAATRGNAETIVATSGEFHADVSEAEALGLETTPSRVVAPPRLAASPVHLECRLVEVHRYGRGDARTNMVVAEVVHIAADDEVLDERGNVDPARAGWLARLGGADYIAVEEVFQLKRPKMDDLLRQE